MKTLIGLIIFIESVLLISCTGNQRLNRSLEEAGPNRGELEKVLEHYKDSGLKYKAACFLIEGMPGQFAYKSSKIDSLKLLKAMSATKGDGTWTDSVLKVWSSFSYTTQPKEYDLKVITADYLIRHIDRVFRVWNSRPWAKYYSFEDFCRWVLPYRIGDEPLEEWYESYRHRYAPLLDSLYQGSDVVLAVSKLADTLRNQGFVYNTDFTLPHLGAKFLLEHSIGICRESCDFTIYVLRSLGIPVHYDYYLASPYTRSGHQWNVLKDTTGLIVPFWYTETDVKRGGNDGRKKGKVFRSLYGSEIVEDVTSDYFGHNCIEVEVDTEVKSENIYLSVYTPDGYKILDKGVRKGNKVVFYDVEPGVRFQPLTKNGDMSMVAGYSFCLRHDGSLHYFIPDTLHTTSAKLYRKYPFHIKLKEYISQMTGARLDVSNTVDFLAYKELYFIRDSIKQSYNYFYPSLDGKFRYVRLTPPDGMNLEVAEIAFYDKVENKEKIAMKVLPEYPSANGKNPYLSMYDNDGLTLYWGRGIGESVIFDFGKSIPIKKIFFTPRNDDNFIRIGDTYELFYQDGIRGWRSLGRQTAATDELVYYNIPSGALLLLKDYTRGKEEQQFEMRNGEQYFY